MSQQVECPAEGCEYGPKPPSSVAGHYQAKTDGMHPGGRQRCMDLLAGGSASGGASQQASEQAEESTPDSSPSQAPQQAASAERGSDPVAGTAEPSRSPEASQRASQQAQDTGGSQRSRQMQEAGQDPVCPKCGGEVYDFRQYESGQYHKAGGHSVFVAGDFQCSSCGRWWVDE